MKRFLLCAFLAACGANEVTPSEKTVEFHSGTQSFPDSDNNMEAHESGEEPGDMTEETEEGDTLTDGDTAVTDEGDTFADDGDTSVTQEGDTDEGDTTVVEGDTLAEGDTTVTETDTDEGDSLTDGDTAVTETETGSEVEEGDTFADGDTNVTEEGDSDDNDTTTSVVVNVVVEEADDTATESTPESEESDSLCPAGDVSPDDADGDSLLNNDEFAFDTDRCSADTDGDGLTDGEEVYFVGTSPRRPDTDGDDMLDGEDYCPFVYGDFYDGDSDELLDGQEVEFRTDLCLPDSDFDSVFDGVEVATGTDPLVSDTDGDGFGDGSDLCPAGVMSAEWMTSEEDDSDGDKLKDDDEAVAGTDPCNGDTDGDSLHDEMEVNGCWSSGSPFSGCQKLDPLDADTDYDSQPDGRDTCPTMWGYSGDSDADGLADRDEWERRSNACYWDSDDDGFQDSMDDYPMCDEAANFDRGQMAEVIVKQLGFVWHDGDPFVEVTDVPSDHPSYLAVQIMLREGLYSLDTEGGVRVDDTVRRAEAARMVSVALLVAGVSFVSDGSAEPFGDVNGDEWFLGAVSVLWADGYYSTIPENSPYAYGSKLFRPSDLASECFVADLLMSDATTNPYDYWVPFPPDEEKGEPVPPGGE